MPVTARSIPAGAGEPWASARTRSGATVRPRGRGGAFIERRPGSSGAGPSPRARGSRVHRRRARTRVVRHDQAVRLAALVGHGVRTYIRRGSRPARGGFLRARLSRSLRRLYTRGRRSVGARRVDPCRPTGAASSPPIASDHPRLARPVAEEGELHDHVAPGHLRPPIPAGAAQFLEPAAGERLGQHLAHERGAVEPFGRAPREDVRDPEAAPETAGWIARPAPVGSIPAGAGEPTRSTWPSTARRVHPRGRGGAAIRPTAGGWRIGPSPRARGSRVDQLRQHVHRRSIPAGAGEPSRARGAPS
jgi:hypothetical protein